MSDLTLPHRFTLTGGQQTALAALRDAVREPATAPSLLLVTGDAGSGKSVMLAALLDRLAGDSSLAAGAVVDAGTEHSDARLLRALIAAFDEEPAGRSGIELLTTLRAIFAARAESGPRPVLLIDGAETLTGSQLEVIRSLLTPATGTSGTRHPAIILSGRPEIRERIRRRRPLAQRRSHDHQMAAPDRADLARLAGGTMAQADLLMAAATQRGLPPLALAALVAGRPGKRPLDDAGLRAMLRAVPGGETAERQPDVVVQRSISFAPASERGNGNVRQLSLLHAGDYAGINAGGGDR